MVVVWSLVAVGAFLLISGLVHLISGRIGGRREEVQTYDRMMDEAEVLAQSKRPFV